MKRLFQPSVLLPVVLLAVMGVWWRALAEEPRLRVTFLDVGQGDSIVIRSPDGKTLVVDAGPAWDGNDAGRVTVLPFLRAQGVRRLDGLLLTHPDGDHIGGAATLLERLEVGRLLLTAALADAADYLPLRRTARRRGTEVVWLSAGQGLDFQDGLTVTALSPPWQGVAVASGADNENSLVLRLRYGRTALLLTGDAGEEAEAALLRSGENLRADILKVAHHGSRSATTERFLKAVLPRAAVVSAGRHNPFGHPHPDVVQRVQAAGARLFRTDQEGAVTVTSDGRTLRVTTMLSGK